MEIEQPNYLEFVSGETFPFIIYLWKDNKPIIIPEIWPNAILEFKIKNSNAAHFDTDSVYTAYNMLEDIPRFDDMVIIEHTSLVHPPSSENFNRLHQIDDTYYYFRNGVWLEYDIEIKFQINSWDSKGISPRQYLFEANFISALLDVENKIKVEYYKNPIITNHILYVGGSLNA